MPLSMPRSCASSGDTSTKVSGVFSLDAVHAVGQIAFVKMLQQAAVVQMQVEFRLGLFRRPRHASGNSRALPSGKSNLFV